MAELPHYLEPTSGTWRDSEHGSSKQPSMHETLSAAEACYMSASPHSATSRNPLVAPALQTDHRRSHLARPGFSAASVALLAGWHLLSLDAPTVAALWVGFIARAAGLTLSWEVSAAMFTAVWILYAADRLLDSRHRRRGISPSGLEARHRFHHRYRAGFYAGLALACPGLVWLLRQAEHAALRLDVLLGAVLFAWFLLIHARSGSSRLPKELAVGLFFPAAIFIPTVARLPALRPALVPDALLLAAVCSLNCLYIFAWEHPRRHHAHWSTRWLVPRLPLLTGATFVASLAVAAVFESSGHVLHQPHRLLALPALACAGSAALLLCLHQRRDRMSSLTLRAFADACLLTPALLLPILGHVFTQ